MVLEKNIYAINNKSVKVEKKKPENVFNTFIEDILEKINEKSNVREYKIRNTMTEVINCVINLVKIKRENIKNDQDVFYDAIADRLLKKEVDAQKEIERLKHKIQRGSLVEAILYDSEEDIYKFLIAKIESKTFYDDNNFDKFSGIDGENINLWKSCLIEIKCVNNEYIIEGIKIYSDTGAKYWSDSFLELDPVSDDEKNTKDVFKKLDSFIASEIKKISPVDYSTLRNSMIGYFKNNNFFDFSSLYENVFENYQTIKLSEDIYASFSEKLKKLPQTKKFDSQFTIIHSAINAKIIKQSFDINTGIQLSILDHVDNINETIISYEENGQKYIKIKIKDANGENQELYKMFLN